MITPTENEQLLVTVTSLLPGNWFVGAPALSVDDEEVLIVGTLSEQSPGGVDPMAFREATREQRMQIADRLAAVAKRSVAWGASANGVVTIYTSLAIPVMTRLRITEREVLDTLVSAGVARSRSDAASWCVRFVGQRESSWLSDLRSTLEGVSKVRAEGPTLS
ncbi:MAG TPA: hypothetical protein VII84_03745 [Acidimicrobiales bacterium]